MPRVNHGLALPTLEIYDSCNTDLEAHVAPLMYHTGFGGCLQGIRS